MKRLVALAALLLASTAAQAQYTFDYGGRTIRIDPDRGTVSIPGVYDNTGRHKRARHDRDSERAHKASPEQARIDPQAPAAPPVTTEQSPAVNTPPQPPVATANVAPADTPAALPPPINPSSAPIQRETDTNAPKASTPVVATAPAAFPAAASATPIGLWLTEEKEGKVRIEQCGNGLCGYSVDKSNQNGEQVLINMKPGKDSRWSGRILDPNTGSTYDSTIALKSPDTLRIEGCALSGMFCGGQTWSRLN